MSGGGGGGRAPGAVAVFGGLGFSLKNGSWKFGGIWGGGGGRFFFLAGATKMIFGFPFGLPFKTNQRRVFSKKDRPHLLCFGKGKPLCGSVFFEGVPKMDFGFPYGSPLQPNIRVQKQDSLTLRFIFEGSLFGCGRTRKPTHHPFWRFSYFEISLNTPL